jgi:hypothetical protein
MDNTSAYGQMDFSLPHDVIKLPSKGKFYRNKKESLKVGYLTAEDENILLSPNIGTDGIISRLLRQKIYEPNFDINELIDADVQAILVFLRNTSFGPEYNFTLIDPATGKEFEGAIILDSVDYVQAIHEPSEQGYFTTTLPKSGHKVVCKIMNMGDQNELEKIIQTYPKGFIAPTATKRLEKQIISIDDNEQRDYVSKIIPQLPIADSKFLRKFLNECEPKVDLKREIVAPSGEKVTMNVSFGAEFFRPFF